mmetsp:Transcript_4957/g.9660  ORF Transcript_4957/g.9660 Transcript_4957/m.9660 type:complete len:84 (+) Transcript_4957:491-742(+)
MIAADMSQSPACDYTTTSNIHLPHPCFVCPVQILMWHSRIQCDHWHDCSSWGAYVAQRPNLKHVVCSSFSSHADYCHGASKLA